MDPRPESAIDLGRVVALPMEAGQTVVVRGEVRTSFDGVVYDGAVRYDDQGARPGGLLALEGTGFRVVHQERGKLELEATGEAGATCNAAGLASPCFVPRTPVLAHERLLSIEEFNRTLTGRLSYDAKLTPAPVVPPSTVAPLAVSFVIVMTLALALAVLQVQRNRPLARVKRAAKRAQRAIANQPAAAALRAQIEGLVKQAETLDSLERRTADELRGGRVRRAESKGADAVRVSSAAETGAFDAKERAELERLERDRERSRRGIEEICAALRVLALKGASGTEQMAEAERALVRLDEELALRDEADAEAAEVLRQRP